MRLLSILSETMREKVLVNKESMFSLPMKHNHMRVYFVFHLCQLMHITENIQWWKFESRLSLNKTNRTKSHVVPVGGTSDMWLGLLTDLSLKQSEMIPKYLRWNLTQLSNCNLDSNFLKYTCYQLKDIWVYLYTRKHM